MTRRNHPEDALHMAVAQYLDLALPKDAAWTTVEHGGKRTKAEAGKLKTKGVKPGWPDIIIFWRWEAIAIELKSEKGRLSPVQKKMHERLRIAGVHVYTAKCIEEVEGFLRAHMHLRATTGARAA